MENGLGCQPKRHHDRYFPEDAWFDERRKYSQVISLNGSGRSGKTTLAKMLAQDGIGTYTTLYTMRDFFHNEIYQRHLERSDEQRNVEVFGIASLGWMIAEFHWRVKPYLNEMRRVIFDHFFYDFYIECMPEFIDIKNFNLYLRCLLLPRFDRGVHIYCDIDYETYLERSSRPNIDNTKMVVEENMIPEHFFNERRERFINLCETESNLILVDTMQSIDDTYQTIRSYTDKYFQSRGLQ